MFSTCFSTGSWKEQREFSHKTSATSSFRSKPEKHLSRPHPKPNSKVPQHWEAVQKISFPMERFLLIWWITRGQKYPQILECSSSRVSLQTQNRCLWNCNSGGTRLKILHIPNDLRAYIPFKMNKCMHLEDWSLQPLVVTWVRSPVPGCGIVGPLFSNAHFCIWKVRYQSSVVCVTPSPRASISGMPVTVEGVKKRCPWPCWYMPKEQMFYRTVVPDQNDLAS